MILYEENQEVLIDAARRASERAYCPYSKFRVGAALLTSSGHTIMGCNVENASYGLTICAERSAVFQAIAAHGPVDIVGIAVYTPTPQPTFPCGACRQVLWEFGPSALVICVCDGPDILRTPLTELLPKAFGPKDLS